ncbi:MAG: hypothetical protein ACYTF6_13390 [Planctomycetota bacterium]|jgi:hypothetical protein
MPKPGKTLPTPDRLAAYKLGRQWRISDKDLKHFLRERWNG